MNANARTVQCVIVTPERAVVDEPVDFVALPMYDGELGVLPGRSPLIGRLGYGELRLRQGERTERYYVDGGFAQIRANVVTVLTPRAVHVEQINTQAAEQMLEEGRVPSASPEEQEARRRMQARARAQLHLARRLRSEI
jgi:F-type H+-transporting ATPase subunit epsilon